MIRTFRTKDELAAATAAQAADSLKLALDTSGMVRLLVATGASQLEFLQKLTATPGIDWQRVELFHLDEYVGFGEDHPASFARYIRERIIKPTGIERYHLLDGRRDPTEEAAEMGVEIRKAPIDLAFAGIGENGHLAFNDPPADFETEEPYLVVQLDEACRRQQVGEGWFSSIDDVPRQALSISVHQLLQSREIICAVPDARKAAAVKACLEGPITPMAPASILRTHPNTTIFLDAQSASLLSKPAV
jgi:glucosamine-6-phosphate deaminase